MESDASLLTLSYRVRFLTSAFTLCSIIYKYMYPPPLQALKRLRTAEFKPYVIFVKPRVPESRRRRSAATSPGGGDHGRITVSVNFSLQESCVSSDAGSSVDPFQRLFHMRLGSISLPEFESTHIFCSLKYSVINCAPVYLCFIV